MPDDLLNDWLTKTQAAAFLLVSEKTIERLATKGDVRRATRKRPGVRPLPVYDLGLQPTMVFVPGIRRAAL